MSWSFGFALASPHGERAEDLLARADAAMYAAKKSGSGVSTPNLFVRAAAPGVEAVNSASSAA